MAHTTEALAAVRAGEDEWRARSATQALDWLLPIAKRVGVTRLANITGLDRIGLPVWTAIRPLSRALATSQGKGLDDAAAKIGALMESVEVWHAEHYEGSLLYESLQRLGERQTVPVDALPRIAGSVLQRDEPLLWARGVALDEDREVLVPWECVSLNLAESGAQRRKFVMSSSGLAGGNSEDEAVVQALQELVERHSLAVWRRLDAGEVKARQIDAEKILVPDLRQLLARIEPHATIGLWDMTTIPGVPAFACLLVPHASDVATSCLGACAGYAADCHAAAAATKAVLEAVQARATLIAGSRDDIDLDERAQGRDESLLARMRAEIAAPRPEFALANEPASTGLDARGRREHLLRALDARGFRTVVKVDLARTELGVPVVKLIVPGLEQASLSARTLARRQPH